MRALVQEVFRCITGSIRDDGPLPDTMTDALTAQAEMRKHTSKATMVVMVATALHSIAVGICFRLIIRQKMEVFERLQQFVLIKQSLLYPN